MNFCLCRVTNYIEILLLAISWFCLFRVFELFPILCDEMVDKMLQNSTEWICDQLYSHIAGTNKLRKGLLVKKHVENLQSHGDLSFSKTWNSWKEFIDVDSGNESSGSKYLSAKTGEIVEASRNWALQVKIIKQEKDRVYIFLDRTHCIPVGLRESLKNTEYLSQLLQKGINMVHCDTLCAEGKDVTTLRLQCFRKCVENLCAINPRIAEHCKDIYVSTKSSSLGLGRNMLLCGAVLNSKTGAKETLISADDFIRKRQNEMTLIAQHKYGVRVTTDHKWQEFIRHLGESASTFDLLQTKPSTAVKINFECSTNGSSKGASFILYNCARLETIIRTYKEKVEEGIYPKLPEIDDVDLTLLTQEEEWSLIYNYIMGLPSLLDQTVALREGRCDFLPHHICSFLSSMVRVFSQYYRKTRILIEPRKHLLPVTFARMHMLIILNNTLKICLSILNIKTISQMYKSLFYSTSY